MSYLRCMCSPFVLTTLILPLCVGCVSSEQLAIDRAVREYDCPKSEVKVRYLNTVSKRLDAYDIYRVNACGQVATYECSEMSGCEKESDRPEE